ncbi:aspartate-semialdehyde dehydrogenase [Candidatus Peribacteria bacterium]|nr:aspartate-semialdehyde dehydrogenase [Candidatus Peribacteria bacterium]
MKSIQKKTRVGILGATGMVGQQYINLLVGHPWFQVTHVVASSNSAGKSYGEAVEGRWHMKNALPETIKKLMVYTVDDLASVKKNCDFVFSALDSDIAKIWEEKYAEAGIPVVSNASTHRTTSDVPMIIPEVNPEHLDMIKIQQKNRGWSKGFIVVKPNCSIQSYIAPLAALHKKFTLKSVIVTTMQAISGAGHPGVASLDILENVIPLIKGEEEKSELEPRKILGSVKGNAIVSDTSFTISAHCNRVPTIDGHLACVSFSCEKKPSEKEILNAWKNFKGVPQELDLPFAPIQAITYTDEANRPQPRLDRDNDKGMTVSVGRLREDPVLQWKFVGLSHNTIRGAAGGGILIAELLKAKGSV